MAGKTVETRAPISLEAIKARVQEKYSGVMFDVPGYGTVELAMLKRSEREAIIIACRRPDSSWDNMLQDRMAASYGLINPKLSADDLKDYPDDFIESIANEVWRMSNAYRDEREKGNGTGPAPFSKTSSLIFGSSTEPTSPSKS